MLLALTGCRQGQSTSTASAQELREAAAFPIPADRLTDDSARLFAGLPAKPGSAFAALETEAFWKQHASQSDRGWRRFLTQRQPLMRDFALAQLADAPLTRPTLFYPFGGPDIMTAQTLFPKASTYVLVGLEPPGTLPDARELQASAQSYLPKLRSSLGSILSKSFFVTREMDRQLRGQSADGLLPVMLIELVRNGNTVRGLRYITLEAGGRWINREAGEPGINDGVVVEFASTDNAVHRLVYFSVNLHNDKYTANSAFHHFVANLGPRAAMFKSTSYMPHRDEFSLIRTQVLEQADSVVQDDSGIPYRFFEPANWEVKLYGAYEQPYGSFKYRRQEDLRDAFTDPAHVSELPFSIGYGFGRMKSNLLVARRRR